MRNILGHILLCFAQALCFCFAAAAFPQGNDYDLALDKYARICDRCVELRTGVESGQGVSMAELKGLLAELSSLRKTLSNASGKMSATQYARFEAIKNKYLQGMTMSVKNPGRPEFSPVPNIEPVTEPVEVTSQAFGFEALRQAQSLRQAQRPDTSARRPDTKAGFRNRGPSIDKAQSASAGPKIAIMADVGIFPAPSYGAICVATRNSIGAYVHYSGNFRKNEYSYSCTSDGATEYGSIWATGESQESRTVATVGFTMFPSRHLGFCAGAGLTSYRLCWEDVSGEWAKVEDKSFRKFAVETGVLLNFKSLILSLGVNSDFLGHADAHFGIGIRF